MFKKNSKLATAIAFSAVLLGNDEVEAQEALVFDVAIGKACWIEGYTNSAAVWTVTLMNGEKVGAVLEGAGVNFAPMAVKQGSARFDVAGGVRGTFEAAFGGNPMNVRVRVINGSILSDNGDPAVFHSLVGGEDGGDDDWQDVILNLTCLHHAG